MGPTEASALDRDFRRGCGGPAAPRSDRNRLQAGHGTPRRRGDETLEPIGRRPAAVPPNRKRRTKTRRNRASAPTMDPKGDPVFGNRRSGRPPLGRGRQPVELERFEELRGRPSGSRHGTGGLPSMAPSGKCHPGAGRPAPERQRALSGLFGEPCNTRGVGQPKDRQRFTNEWWQWRKRWQGTRHVKRASSKALTTTTRH
mmetsp:Transcript_17701/g.49003  ORF Transcript_17701/g.49003 Transcript_17701/m.49003 type:complete len:200 (-) Transcript_17701:1748-2347(-)